MKCFRLCCLLGATLACAPPAAELDLGPDVATLRIAWNDGRSARDLFVDESHLGTIELDGTRQTLATGSALATLRTSERPVFADRAYPRRIVREGRLAAGGPTVRQEYTLLAPAAPIDVEGLGLEVASDDPGTNETEHAAIRKWLESQGLAPDTTPFERLHREDSGRELTVWYEISGRRVDGSVSRSGAPEPVLARFDSLFRSTPEGLKIHHARPGENGRFFYHRTSLELVDTLADEAGSSAAIEAHQCGCYGYGIASDFVTFGASHLYQVAVEWENYRVATGFFLGFRDRRRTRDLARRVKSYRMNDANEQPFADVVLAFSPDPPANALGPSRYEVRLTTGPEALLAPLASIEVDENRILVKLPREPDLETSLERLDALLAAMPTQVVRGDGVRDSHLGDVETAIDWLRLLLAPSVETLGDVVSEIDAPTAAAKVESLFDGHAARFAAAPDRMPSPPLRRSPTRQADATR